MNNKIDHFINKFYLYINNKEGIKKIVINSDKPNIHYTIFLKGISGEIDIHRTNEKTNYHKTLFKIKELDALYIVKRFELIIPSLFEKLLLSNIIDRKILLQKDWYILPSDEKTIDPKLIFKISTKKIRFNKNVKNLDFSKYYKPIKRINRFSSNLFTVYSKNHRVIGSLIKLSINPKENIFIIIKKSSITKFSQDCFDNLIEIVYGSNIENKDKVIRLLNKITKEIKFN